MGTLEIAGIIVGLVLVVVGPGSGIYLVSRWGWQDTREDIAEIKKDLKGYGEGAAADRMALSRGLERLEVQGKEIGRLRTQQDKHASIITGLSIRCEMNHPKGGQRG